VVLANPFRTPTKDEFALFEAVGAARLSAEPGRQVGAALANPQGEIIALGTNEVPRPGGGIYREGGGDPDVPDQREFRYGKTDEERRTDTNDRMQREIAEEITDALKDESRKWPAADVDADEPLAVILTTRLGDLTEFGRAVHAEMSAILDAARNGHTVAGSTLYVTTFPCHNCVRHIVCAGITNCVFLAPYAKSQAETLHGDSIAVATGGPVGKKEGALRSLCGRSPAAIRRVVHMATAQGTGREPVGLGCCFGQATPVGRRAPGAKTEPSGLPRS
jgi:deoxycytidylate deaminase